MNSQCNKYEDRLSAYLDGRLSPQEMAEIAAHLDACPACSALLEKMRHLEEMAAGVSTDFDNNLMDELSGRINAGVNEIGEIGETPGGRTAKIIPVWYRYAAIAASFAIVFFVGRMAFKETAPDLKRHQMMSAPKMHSPSIYYDVSPEVDKPVPVESESTWIDETAKRISIPSPVETEGSMAQPIADETEPVEEPVLENAAIQSFMDSDDAAVDAGKPTVISKSAATKPSLPQLEDVEQQGSKKGARDKSVEIVSMEEDAEPEAVSSKIAGRITDRKTGEPLRGVAVQIEGTSLGALTDIDGEFIIYEIPPDTYTLVCSSIGYEIVEIADIAVVLDSDSRQDAQMEPMAITSGVAISVSGDRKDLDAKSAFAKPPPEGKSEEAKAGLITIDSLEALYEMAVSGPGKMMAVDGFREDSYAQSASVMRSDKAKSLLDSMESAPRKQKSFMRLESLYLRARANYDLYKQTRDEAYLDNAIKFKSALLEIIGELLEQDEDNSILLDYKSEIERWKF